MSAAPRTYRLKHVLYYLFDTLVLALTPRNRRKLAAIVRVDNIGDFVMWLPYARALIRTRRATHDAVVLVCNSAWAELAAHELPEIKVIGVDKRRFKRELSYRAHLLRTLRALGARATWHPTYSRDFVIGDALVRACGGEEVVGHDGDLSNRNLLDRRLGDRWYTSLVPAPDPLAHETVRNHQFLTAVNGGPLDLAGVQLRGQYEAPQGLGRYFVIAPSASSGRKMWPLENFAAIANRLFERSADARCVIVGGGSERPIAERLAGLLRGPSANLAGQTELKQYVAIIKGADLVLSNDSSAAHIAAALGVPCVAMVGGGHFNRFLPYPRAPGYAVATAPRAVHHAMPCFNCYWKCIYSVPQGAAVPCIDRISVEDVWREASGAIAAPAPPR